jgi:hypothetical protein
MTIEDLERQAQLIAESERKFVETIRDLSGLIDQLISHQSTLMSYLKTWRDLFASSGDLFHQQIELHKESLEAMKSLSKAVAGSAVSTDANTERLEKLIVKVESYFGTGEGLDYEN